jgi:hypothetical protein
MWTKAVLISNLFSPSALQIDFAHHALESVRIVDNMQDGLGIIYSDLYSSGGVNTVRNCEFSNNRGSGVSLKQLGLKIFGKYLFLTFWWHMSVKPVLEHRYVKTTFHFRP